MLARRAGVSRLPRTGLGYPNFVLRKAAILVASAALGAASAVALAACGEEREGELRIEGGTTGTTGTGTTGTGTTDTDRTATSP